MSERLVRAPRAGHMVQLDGLRALSVFGVVLYHYGPPSIANALDAGPLGVRLFFVLSGFLITSILLDARRLSIERAHPLRGVLGAFYARRFLRIFPVYYFVLFVCVAAGVPSARQYLPWHVTYTTNVLMTLSNGWLPALDHFWSLSVEEQFYLFWPMVVLFTPPRHLRKVLVALVLTGPASRALLIFATGKVIQSTHLMPTCLDSLGLGALLAQLRRSSDWTPANRRRVVGAALSAGLGLYAIWSALRALHVGVEAKVILKDASYGLLCFCLVDRAASGFTGPLKRALEWPPLVYVGVISYGVYVYHDVLPLLDRALLGGAVFRLLAPEARGMRSVLAVFSASCAAASLSWHLLEEPLNRLKSRFPYLPVAPRPPEEAAR